MHPNLFVQAETPKFVFRRMKSASVHKEGCRGKFGFEALIFSFWTDFNKRPIIYLMVHLPTPKSRRITPNKQSGMHPGSVPMATSFPLLPRRPGRRAGARPDAS